MTKEKKRLNFEHTKTSRAGRVEKRFRSINEHELRLEEGKAKQRFSYEIHSGEEFVRYLFVKNPHVWLTIEDIEKSLEENGIKLRRSSLYNLLYKLKRIDLIESRRSSFAKYRLKQLECENHPIGGSSYSCQRWRLDFFDYLETLPWEDVRRIHDIKLWTSIERCDFVDENWSWKDNQGKYLRRELVDGKYRFTFETYVKAGSLVVSVGCANCPFAVDIEGLTHFYSVLCGVRAEYLNSASVPHVSEWIVKQWHYGRDTKNSVSGASFELSFHDWFGNLIRVYTRNKANHKMRIERVENPNIRVSKLLDGVDRTRAREPLANEVHPDELNDCKKGEM